MIERDRGIVIVPVHGGFVVEWNEQFHVETPKMKALQTPGPEYYGNKDVPMEVPKSTTKYEVAKEMMQHRTAVRETMPGALALVQEILTRKVSFLKKEAEAAEGGVTMGEEKTGVAGNALK